MEGLILDFEDDTSKIVPSPPKEKLETSTPVPRSGQLYTLRFEYEGKYYYFRRPTPAVQFIVNSNAVTSYKIISYVHKLKQSILDSLYRPTHSTIYQGRKFDGISLVDIGMWYTDNTYLTASQIKAGVKHVSNITLYKKVGKYGKNTIRDHVPEKEISDRLEVVEYTKDDEVRFEHSDTKFLVKMLHKSSRHCLSCGINLSKIPFMVPQKICGFCLNEMNNKMKMFMNSISADQRLEIKKIRAIRKLQMDAQKGSGI